MENEKLIRAIVNFFYWHNVVRDYYIDMLSHPSKADEANWGIGLKYIQEHGNSIWAKFDYWAGKVRIVILLLLVLFMVLLMLGLRPHFN